MGNDAAIGWIAAIIIGGLAGWLAEQFMKSNMADVILCCSRDNWGCGGQRHPWGIRRGTRRMDWRFDRRLYRCLYPHSFGPDV